MEVDQEDKQASSAAVTADTSKKGKKESEVSDEQMDKKKTDDSDSEVSSIGDDIPAEAEDQDSDEEQEAAQRLAKHRSVDAGQENVLCKHEKGETYTLNAGEAATAQQVSEVSDEGMESEELESDPEVNPTPGRVWKGRNYMAEPGSPPAASEQAKYRPIKKRRQNKMPPTRKQRAYRECPEPGHPCPNCSGITDMYCRKCGDTTCRELTT